MKVEILHTADCPNWRGLHHTLVELVDGAMPPVTFEVIEVTHAHQGAALGFSGSPTILIDGKDPWPVSRRPVGLSCRLYQSSAGFGGVPSRDEILRAIEEATLE